MQINELISSVNGDPFRSTTKDAKSEHLSSNSGDLFSFSPSSLSFSPSPVSTNGGDDLATTEIGLYLDRLADSDLMSHLAMQLRPEISQANWKSCLSPKHEDGDNTIDDMAISMELSADMDDLMSLEPSQIAPDVKNNSLRNERCVSCIQEATEQEENSDLTSRLAMQLRPERSLTSVLPLQPLNENQLLHHASERQAVPAPKGLALNDGISSVIPVKRKRSPKMPLLEGAGYPREEQPSELDKEVLTRNELDAELLEMWSMDKEAAEAVATDRNEGCLSYIQEATEQEANSDLTSRLAMQPRPESSLTSVLPLQPLNENQLLHHASERQAVPAPKGLALNDGISSVIPVKRKRSPKMSLLEGAGYPREEQPSELDKEVLTRNELDAELLEMWSMDKEAAEAVATDRNEATEQEANSDLTSRLTMQLRLESSLTSVLPLQPLNENQLVHHAAEKQAVPAPKRLASQLNDRISSVIPGPTRVATGAIVILLIFISEAHATLSSDPSTQSKSSRQVCSFPSWRDGLNNTAVDVISYIVLLVGYLVNWFIVMHYEVTKKGQSWMYFSCLLLSCIPLVIISFDDDHKPWDRIKMLTGMVASVCTIALDVARYAKFGHHQAASCFVLGLMVGGAVLFVLEMRAAYVAQFADVGTNLVTTAILIICLLWKKDWEYTTLEVFAAFIAAAGLVSNVTTCELPIAVLTGVAFVARCLYCVLLCYRLSTTGRVASSWKPAWEEMKTWPRTVFSFCYCCKVVISDYFWKEKILRGIEYLWSKSCDFVTLICGWMEETQQEREIEFTPLRVRMDP